MQPMRKPYSQRRKQFLRVGTHDYSVTQKKRIRYRDRECDGLTDCERREISIREGLDTQRKREIEWHETMHAIEGEYKVEIDHDVIEVLAEAIPQILRDNEHMRTVE